MLHDLRQDVRVGWRNLLRAPVLTLTVIATVGLGIGATTAIFAAIDAALLRPLPYPEPDRLVRIYTDSPPNRFRFSLVDYRALEAQQTHFDHVAGFTDRPMAFSDGRIAEQLRGRVVTWTFFRVLGIAPALGRDFTEGDSRVGVTPSVIVSDTFWRERLGGSSDAVGRMIRLDGRDHAVVGVLKPSASPLERRQDFFVVAQWTPPTRKGPFLIQAIGRLRAGADRAAAVAELRAINRQLFPIWKASYQDERATWGMMDLKEFVAGNVATMAGVALGAVALVWLIATANASSLLIARVTSRRRELAVRAALGASRGRVVRYLLAESTLLALGSAGAGLAIAWGGINLLRTTGSLYFPRTQEIALSGTVLWVFVAATIASAILFGLVPAMHGSGGPADAALRSSGRTATASTSVRRLRRVLVGLQFAIATPLLVGAALLIVTLDELRRVDVGFETERVLTGGVQLTAGQYREPGRIEAFWKELHGRLAALPGVAGVAYAGGLPPNLVGNFNNFELEEQPTPPGGSQPVTPWVNVTPDYFQVLGLALVEGRLLTEDDARRQNLEAVVVDRAWARRFFRGQSAVGKRLKSGGCSTCPWTTVVGVVGNVKYAGLDQADNGSVYYPMTEPYFRYVIVRTHGEPAVVAPAVRQTLRDLDPTLPLTDVATIDERVDRAMQTPRTLSLLIAVFAGVALLLAGIGIYGVMAYYVQQQSKDISVRLALGAVPRDVVRLVVGQGMATVGVGVMVGLGGAFALTRLMSSLLFGVQPRDPLAFTLAMAFLLSVAFAASLVPARRAARVDPAVVLRSE